MSTTPIATYEDVKKYDMEALIAFMKGKFGLTENELGIFRDQGIDGESFLMLNEERFKECNIRMGPRAKLVNLINKLNNQKQSGATGFSREPTGLVHIFIDNPNIEIEGKQLISNLENVYEDQLYIDYGRLLKTVLNGRQIGDNPVIVGSCPPTNDSIWRELENLGCQVTVFDQNELGASISDAIQEHKRPGIIVVVSGDGDYRPVLRRALLRDWIVEIWFWDHGMSQHCKWINVPYRPDLQTRITYLDSYYTLFMYAYGRENSRDKKFLEINGDAVETWGNEQVMECYMNLNTFCWWYKPDGHSFHMYFDNLEQWREAKCWVKKIYPEVHEFQKGRLGYISFALRILHFGQAFICICNFIICSGQN
ncbi:hypothetical protein RhiirB3_510339 [Rhizophagus irregularis]|nr:hypothetical protein RhiirB3_510339 [Rhizophagus irregularis]